MVMVCPSHLHGSFRDALHELDSLLQWRDPLKSERSTIFICRVDQKITLIRFASKVDRVVVNPFVGLMQGNSMPHPSWQNSEHPLSRNMKAIRAVAGGTQLIACLATDGDPELFGGRAASFEELQRQVIALGGASYQGIALRGDKASDPLAARIGETSAQIMKYSNHLASA